MRLVGGVSGRAALRFSLPFSNNLRRFIAVQHARLYKKKVNIDLRIRRVGAALPAPWPRLPRIELFAVVHVRDSVTKAFPISNASRVYCPLINWLSNPPSPFLINAATVPLSTPRFARGSNRWVITYSVDLLLTAGAATSTSLLTGGAGNIALAAPQYCTRYCCPVLPNLISAAAVVPPPYRSISTPTASRRSKEQTKELTSPPEVPLGLFHTHVRAHVVVFRELIVSQVRARYDGVSYLLHRRIPRGRHA